MFLVNKVCGAKDSKMFKDDISILLMFFSNNRLQEILPDFVIMPEGNGREGHRWDNIKPNKTKVKCIALMIMLDGFNV